MNEQRFIYLIRAANGLCKIGISNRPKQRFQALQGCSPIELNLIHAYRMDNEAKLIERQLHLHFKDKRIRGEWFNLSNQDIVSILLGLAGGEAIGYRHGWFSKE